MELATRPMSRDVGSVFEGRETGVYFFRSPCGSLQRSWKSAPVEARRRCKLPLKRSRSAPWKTRSGRIGWSEAIRGADGACARVVRGPRETNGSEELRSPRGRLGRLSHERNNGRRLNDFLFRGVVLSAQPRRRPEGFSSVPGGRGSAAPSDP